MTTEARLVLDRLSVAVISNIRLGLTGDYAKEDAIALFRVAEMIRGSLPFHGYASSETAYGRTVHYDFAVKVF